jgi:hypothetical protein
LATTTVIGTWTNEVGEERDGMNLKDVDKHPSSR